ncbi:MAG: TRAP transporter substrate-binding protein [Bacteroidetes bacterium]|nr:TRAP transporter substrate-binding protein [Bacteroidota bacterium]
MRIFSLVLITLLFISCAKLSQTKELKLGHGLEATQPVHLAMQFMADRLAEKSDNKFTIKIYPSQQLGTERELVELLQIGSLAMTKVSAGTLESFAPGMRVFGLPFLFRDKQHGFDFMDSEIGKTLLTQSEKYWLRGVTFFDAGSRSFYTKDKRVDTPEDLEGLKIRVMESPSAMTMVSQLGGSPTPIAWGELYTALQQGVVDGAENNPPSFYFSHHYEVCKYYIIDEHTLLPDVLLISTIIWDKLTDQEKVWLQEAADEATIYQRKLWEQVVMEVLEEVKKAGVEIIYPDKSLFSSKVAGMYKEFEKDENLAQIIKGIQTF